VLWELGPFTNVRLVGAVGLSVAAQCALLAIPATQRLFELGTPSPGHVGLALGLGLVPVTVLELVKLVRRR
jgi:Ca2+-transporting ATPase